MRDLLVNEDMVDAGWERWEARRLHRRGFTANGNAARHMKSK